MRLRARIIIKDLRLNDFTMKLLKRLKLNKKQTTAEKLKCRLIKEFNLDIPEKELPKRLFHGYHQRAIGAWSWSIGGNVNWIECYGSSWNMSEILKAKYLITFKEFSGEISILVVSEEEYKTISSL